ncbi:Putative adaptor protein ClpS, core [Septoria linicola]|uniref:E3 ubiquitin-protein ligase n=1 Tax=Septoria linicola TaxID=215465 RepID=A0A9Q9AZD7_9PEZI|nr:Putative adaptor protein ClpS, core [Septoria linicola]
MLRELSPPAQALGRELLLQPSHFDNRWTHAADCDLRRTLFTSLADGREDYMRLFFPDGIPPDRSEVWSLKKAQGAVEGAEYTAGAKGTACGHIFKNGESTYSCKTCAADDTCVLCARCFESSDHEGHMVMISVSPGNSGCCDCGDHEAWRREVRCSIHTANAETERKGNGKDKQRQSSVPQLPEDLVEAVRMTIARCTDYLCDVFSCAPEQLRLPKTKESIIQDEQLSRLGGLYGEEPLDEEPEYALVLWNDEKHTVDDVQNQVARACSKSKRFGKEKAIEVDNVGRSIITYSRDLDGLINMSEIIEQLKLTVTIRSARDTFREQMCAAIIDWFADISGCLVGDDPNLLRNTICEEFLKPWWIGADGHNRDIGVHGIDDHETEENQMTRDRHRTYVNHFRQPGLVAALNAGIVRLDAEVQDPDDDDDDDEDDENDDENEDDEDEDEDMDDEDDEDGDEPRLPQARARINIDATGEMDIDIMDDAEDGAEVLEATLAGYPPPPPPPDHRRQRDQILTPQDSDDGEAEQSRPAANEPFANVPRTPKAKVPKRLRPSRHWLEKPDAYRAPRPNEPCEDIWQRVRLDYLILYDLRLWKTLRVSLRHLYITTVVTIPHFKRIIGLRIAGLYTALAQLYLIADREPDHSIINLSVQLLTTPSVTQEVVDRGNFLSNLMAILYTFLTTRQVGFPEDVHPKATLAFDAGTVTNRRIFHFFLDLRWLFRSELIHWRMRSEPRYLLQFLDLVKLHQGVCPNIRALGEHVEYESDTWISAQLIVKDVNKLCKELALSFAPDEKFGDHNSNLHRAIRVVGQVTMINAFGYERKRFAAAELRDDLAWHVVGPFDWNDKTYSVPKLVVQSEPMSFHHPLHYLLSWLLENARSMDRKAIRALLQFSPDDLRDPFNHSRTAPAPRTLMSDELLSGIFDHPLRVCVWLAQMKAGMWVRNGITLRHQAHTYRSVSTRDVGYQRDIFMVQSGLVLCGAEDELPGERYLAQMLDRFQMVDWVKGDYSLVPGFEEPQQLDCIEDFFHLLVIALSERGNLLPSITEAEQHDRVLQHDIAHALIFKPLSFSELASRVTEKVGESDDFNRVLESMTTFRQPEGLSDVGTFQLKPEYVELVDPYYAHYSRNYREEAEQALKKHAAKVTGKKIEDVVYEPHLEAIEEGLFKDLAAFTATPLFVQVLGSALNFAVNLKHVASKVQVTRVETFLHMVLHLILLAVLEDKTQLGEEGGFVRLAVDAKWKGPHQDSEQIENSSVRHSDIVSFLTQLADMDEYASSHPAVKNVLRKMHFKRPDRLALAASSQLALLLDRADTGSPASLSAEDKEKKKQEAKARQAKIMAQMKAQQNSFMQNQGLANFGDDEEFSDVADDMSTTEEVSATRKSWNFPTGTCILCQEETDDSRLFGTFAFLGESNILRHTPVDDDDYIQEVLDSPESLDYSAGHLRPFGVAGNNKSKVSKVGADGRVYTTERPGLSKGFPHQSDGIKGPVSTSCGHIMHWHCFELYQAATNRRHASQIARNHPERVECREFICPLCKALGNTFLPVIWRAKDCVAEHELHAKSDLDDWLVDIPNKYQANLAFLDNVTAPHAYQQRYQQVSEVYSDRSFQYVSAMLAPNLMQTMQELTLNSPVTSPTAGGTINRHPFRTAANLLGRPFGLGMGAGGREVATAPGSQFHSGPGDVTSPGTEANRLTDVYQAYKRIDDTIRANHLAPVDNTEGSFNSTVNPIAALSRALGTSVSAWEIAHRGIEHTDPFATSLVKDISEQALTHLRILSETIESHLALNVLKSGSNIIARETFKKRDIITAQLFGTESKETMIKLQNVAGKLLFQDDVFLFFSDWLSFMGPTVAEAANILHLCLWAEVVKVVHVYAPILSSDRMSLTHHAGELDADKHQMWKQVLARMFSDDETEHHPDGVNDSTAALLRVLVDKYALAFMRKSAVLIMVRYGLDFDCPYNLDPEMPETDRLSKLLHILPLDDICKMFVADSSAGASLRTLTDRWLEQARQVPYQQQNRQEFAESESGIRYTNDSLSSLGTPYRLPPQPKPQPIVLPHPTILELVGLPKTYDSLTEEAIKRKCPTTGKDITDPTLCLQCGEIFCSQAVCCMKSKTLGGCYQHMMKHNMRTGQFINIRKCMVLFLHLRGAPSSSSGKTDSSSIDGRVSSGCFMQAPYLDRWGETDPTLRRHQMLFLNAKRYEKLVREVWIGGLVQTVVSRKLEGDINPGGWETL